MSFSLALMLSAATSIATLLAIGSKTLLATPIGKPVTKMEQITSGLE
jgi:hypothetical protein